MHFLVRDLKDVIAITINCPMRVFCRLGSIAVKPPRSAWSREALFVKYTRSTSSSSGSQPPEKHPWIAKVTAPKSFKPEERVLTFLAGLSNT